MTESKPPRMPPRWFVKSAWVFHRGWYKITGGRRGLWKPRPGKWGTMRLTTVGRKSGQERVAILGYYEDGENLVTMAMNGWGEGAPAWWLNLQANPDVTPYNAVEAAPRNREKTKTIRFAIRGRKFELGERTVGKEMEMSAIYELTKTSDK